MNFKKIYASDLPKQLPNNKRRINFNCFDHLTLWQQTLFLNLIIVIIYILSIRVSEQFITTSSFVRITPLWLPSALAFSVFFHFEYQVLPGILLGSAVGAIMALQSWVFPFSSITFLCLTLILIFADNLQPILANFWIKKALKSRGGDSISPRVRKLIPLFDELSFINPFEKVKTTLTFIKAAIAAPLLSASIGIAALALTGVIAEESVFSSWITWWLANALANLIFSPVLILIRFCPWSELRTKKTEILILFIIFLMISLLTFLKNYPIAYLYLPLILVTVFQIGSFVASILVAVITITAIFFTSQGYGVFFSVFHNHPLIFLQSFTGILSLISLFFSALTQERKEAKKALEKMIQSLERRVQCRTCELHTTQLQLQKANQELEKLVNVDGLTQVANRRCFDERIEREWQCLLRNHQPLSLLILDVDYFKDYNDFYGHPQGDACLVQLAQMLSQVVQRSSDLVARYGGEEFVILLPNTELLGAIAVAEQIQAALQKLALPHKASRIQATVTVSIGIASVIPTLTDNSQQLIQKTDQALYQAKQQGRNQYKVFNLL
ncbi:MAG: diguanylate cyclase [Snowella sp.]|nr:diguanylate cyclase [Snowella sp.]